MNNEKAEYKVTSSPRQAIIDEVELKFAELMIRVRRMKEASTSNDQARHCAVLFTELEKAYGYFETYVTERHNDPTDPSITQ